MRVLLVQAAPQPGQPAANAESVRAALAADPGADLAVLPELFLTGYDPPTAHERAIGRDHDALELVREAAREAGAAVVVGFAERRPDGALANSVACIDRNGGWAGLYRKTHLFGREREVFTAGERLLVVELGGRRVGILNCFDVEFPEPARALARAGAELLVTVAANMEPYGPDHALAVRARALDNRLPHVYVNRTGSDGEIRLAKRTHLYSMPGAVALAVVVLLLLIPTFDNVVGYDFASMPGLADPAAYGFAGGAPAYPELIGIAAGSAVVGVIAILGFTIALLVWLPQTLLLVSRNMFAWSFDRVMPERLSQVDPRSRSPIYAIGAMLVLSIASTAVYSFTDWFSSLSALVGLTLSLVVTAIAGMLLPFRQPALVEGSPYNRRVAGIPLLTLVGGLALLGFADAVAILLWDVGSGASLSEDPEKLLLALGVYVAAVVIWLVARALRRREGIDLDLAYRELPSA
jgi:predicted amidohydrolase